MFLEERMVKCLKCGRQFKTDINFEDCIYCDGKGCPCCNNTGVMEDIWDIEDYFCDKCHEEEFGEEEE